MMYQQKIDRQSITIEGEIFDSTYFREDNFSSFTSKSEFHKDLFLFLKEWFSDSEYLSVKTSGSTGTPKEILVEKQKMMQSAMLTCSFLGLKVKDKALLCMSLQYIAGKMFVVRALVAGLNLYLVSPSGNPLRNCYISFDFAAMVPLQVYNSLQNKDEIESLQNVKNLIIGGGAISPEMAKDLSHFSHHVFSTYGMTETLSHIALRRLSGENASENYVPFNSVKLSLSQDDTLIIDAPLVSDEVLITNDIAEIYSDGSFKILGRKDNVVNSGGIKIQIEEVEKIYSSYIDVPFAVSSKPDAKFGEVLVLVAAEDINLSFLEKIFPIHFRIKEFIKLNKIPLTETSKIERARLKHLLASL